MRTRRSEVVCKCGAVYERIERSIPARDIEDFSCEVCGDELEHFSGAAVVSYSLVRMPDTPKN